MIFPAKGDCRRIHHLKIFGQDTIISDRVETLGNVVLEALASGLPVVGVAEGGTLENVRDGVNGVLCTPGDVGSFAQGIRRIVSDDGYRRTLATNARSWAEERTWDRAFAPLIEKYEELAAR